jgi:hypothetical protein
MGVAKLADSEAESIMFRIGALILIVWAYCFFCQNLPLKVSVAMMIGGLFSMGWGLLSEKK